MTSLPEWAWALKAAQCLSVRAGHITNEHQLGWSRLLYPFSVMCVLLIFITNHCLQLLTLVPAARTATTQAEYPLIYRIRPLPGKGGTCDHWHIPRQALGCCSLQAMAQKLATYSHRK